MMKYCVFVLIVLVFHIATCKNNKITHSTLNKSLSIKYYTKQTDIRIPIMIHLDNSLTRILSKEHRHRKREKFKLLAKDIIKDVENIFTYPNMHQKIKLELLEVKMIRNNTKKVKINENVSKYLKSYCEWQGGKKTAKGRWFYSVLFTALDVYYLDKQGAKVRSSTGRGYMRGMCSNKNSCTVLEWHPQNIAFLLAHEIAHSLGINHDGPPFNDCHGQRFIMDGKYNAKNPPKLWSTCSKKALAHYLKSKRAWCLKSNSPITLYKN